jgi:nucleotide-binding universal stress UspA family protein
LPDGVVPASPESYDRYMREVEQRLGEWRELREQGGAAIDVATAMGDPAGQIVTFAREHDFDVVVIGTHGRTGLSHALLGSIAEKVVRTSERPVLTVKGGS